MTSHYFKQWWFIVNVLTKNRYSMKKWKLFPHKEKFFYVILSLKSLLPCYNHVGLGNDELPFLFQTHLPLSSHICVRESGPQWFRLWLVAYSAPSHYLNQCCGIVIWTLRNKLQCNFNQNKKHFIHKIASENNVCEVAAILFRGDELTHFYFKTTHLGVI